MTKVNSKGHFFRLYLYRKDVETGLVSIESCISTKENNLAWYVRYTWNGKLNINDSIDPKQY